MLSQRYIIFIFLNDWKPNSVRFNLLLSQLLNCSCYSLTKTNEAQSNPILSICRVWIRQKNPQPWTEKLVVMLLLLLPILPLPLLLQLLLLLPLLLLPLLLLLLPLLLLLLPLQHPHRLPKWNLITGDGEKRSESRFSRSAENIFGTVQTKKAKISCSIHAGRLAANCIT